MILREENMEIQIVHFSLDASNGWWFNKLFNML